LTVWCRRNGSMPNVSVVFAQWDSAVSEASIMAQESATVTDGYGMHRSSDGTGANSESRRTATGGVFPTTDATSVFQWVDGGARFVWANNTSIAITTVVGSSPTQTQRFNSSVDVTQNALLSNNVPTQFMGGEFTALAFLEGPEPTTTQRETITNLINAL
jgi:hypothetical protein